MSALQQKVVRIVLDDSVVLSFGSFIGESCGSGIFNNGRMFITLKLVSERKERGDAVINRLRAKLARVEGITLFLQPVQDIRMGGRSGKAQFQYALQTADLTE